MDNVCKHLIVVRGHTLTDLQKQLLRAGTIRTRLSELAGVQDMNDETRSELDALRSEYGDVERKVQALSIAEDAPRETRSEDREWHDLVTGASVGAIFSAAMEHRSADGRERELQEHLGLKYNQIPLALLRYDGELETRATGPTPAPANVGSNQSEIIPDVFPASCASFLGVDTPSVGVGDAVFPVLITSADVGTPAENAAQPETAGAFTADLLTPSRLQAAFIFSREDRARFAGMDAALRMNLSDALSDKLDREIIRGTNGLLTGTNLANHAASAVTTFANYKSDFAFGRVDGKWAMDAMDLRIVMGSATYAHSAITYRASGNNADSTDAALEVLMRSVGGVKVSSHVPAVASSKQNAVIRLGARRDMVAPIWEGITLIPDEVTKAANGQIVITAVMLHAVKILRKDGFYKIESQHA